MGLEISGSRYIAKAHVRSVANVAATVLLDPQEGKYYTLNASAGRIWALLSKPVTLASLVETMRAEFSVPQERIESDAVAVLERLFWANLIELQDGE